MMKSELTIALYQQNIFWNDRESNYDRIRERLLGVSEKVDIIILPETFSCGFGDNMIAMAESQDGPSLCFAAEMAARYDALFVATWPVREDDGRVFNRLHWVFPDGTFGTYDKAHTFRVSGEADIIASGNKREIFEWRGWHIKPAICYDLRFPKWLRNEPIYSVESTQTLEYSTIPALSYDILMVCANWPGTRAEAWKTLLKARAIENLSYVVGVNRVGTDGADIAYSGDSLGSDFKGLPIAECIPGEEQIVLAKLSASALDTFRHHWPFHLDFD